MRDSDEHVVPPPIPPAVAAEYVIDRVEHEERTVREYFESQSPDEPVQHVEKLHSEVVMGRRVDVWDVHTSLGRWWVLTNPTNLYSQEHFPSMDYLISFHIGLMARVFARAARESPGPVRVRAAAAWRRWKQATEALDEAEEAEDFQAVGMRCRECLLEFIRAIADDSMIPEGEERPKLADFVGWSERAAETLAQGGSADRVRGYLKATAKATWELVNWLTHAQNAVMYDAQLAIDSTEGVLASFTTATLRREAALPDRCPDCGSYRVVVDFRPDLELESDYIALCERCGWMDSAHS
jgi:hypothetical protein